MKRKNLLNESQVRKFMKLANINNDMADNFLTEGAHENDVAKEAAHDKEEKTMEESESIKENYMEEDEMEGDEALDELPGDEGPVDDMGLDDAPAEDGEVTLTHDDAVNLIQAVVGELAGELGLGAATVTTGDEEVADDAPMDDFDAVDAAAEPVDDLDDDVEIMDEDEIVSETMRRVTHRLNAANEERKIVNEAMRRIQTRYGRGKQ